MKSYKEILESLGKDGKKIKLTKTQQAVMDSLEKRGYFHGIGARACNAVGDLYKLGVIEKSQFKLSISSDTWRGRTKSIREVSVYLK